MECREEVWKAAGLDRADEGGDASPTSRRLFADELRGHRLLTNRSIWRSFPTVRNARWHHGNVVLMGDAAHTAHFSIGSGTKIAMEDAIALAGALRRAPRRPAPGVLQAYEDARKPEVGRLQTAAQTSLEWFENSARYLGLDPLTFAFSLLTRSKRITYDNLARRDPALVAAVDRALRRGDPDRTGEPTAPPIFQPFRLRGLRLANRIVVSPMCQYSCEDGTVDRLAPRPPGDAAPSGGPGWCSRRPPTSRAKGASRPVRGNVQARARGGLEADRGLRPSAFRRPHRPPALPRGTEGLVHACPGRATIRCRAGGWEVLGPSALSYDEGWPVPREMTRADMDRVRGEFVRAARMAEESGFDMLELHMAHGYLLATFISPLTNRREDEYGGADREPAALPAGGVRRGAGGVAGGEADLGPHLGDGLEGGRPLERGPRRPRAGSSRRAAADAIDVSGGQTVPDQRPVYGRMFQVPFSEEIRLEAGIPTMTVGNVQDADQANTILAAGTRRPRGDGPAAPGRSLPHAPRRHALRL